MELAKEELIKIYKKTIDFKYYGYVINEYQLMDKKYIYTKTSYVYNFDKFIEINDCKV